MRDAFIRMSPEHAITARSVSKENQWQRRAEVEQVIIKVPCKCPVGGESVSRLGSQKLLNSNASSII